MPQPRKSKLTDAAARNAALPEGKSEMILWDTEVTGFGLRVRGASKSYIVAYRPAGAGRSSNMKRVKIGTPNALTASDARKAARVALGKVAAGGDPAKERSEQRKRTKSRIADLLDAYDKDLQRRGYVAHKQVMSTLRRDLANHTGKDIADLRGADYAAIIQRHEAKNLPGAAEAFRARCRMFLTWCVFEAKVLNSNPLAGYRKPRGTRTERLAKKQHGRALSDDELAAVWSAADPGTVFGRYVRFLIISGCRRNEGAGLTWAMVDRANGKIELPAAFTKQARGHTVYLSPAMIEILDACPLGADNDGVVFASVRTGGKMSGWSKTLPKLVERSGVKFAFHDLRRTFRTGLSRLGVETQIAELALGHARADLEARYNRDDCAEALRNAFGEWSARVALLNQKGDLI